MDLFMKGVRDDWYASQPWVLLLIVTISLDVGFGLAVGFARKGVSSTISRVGTARKMLMLASVLVASLFDGVLPSWRGTWTIFGLSYPLSLTVAIVASMWWMVTEWISIAEKAALLKMPIPKRIKAALLKAQEEFDGGLDVDVEGKVTLTPSVATKPERDVTP